MPEQVERPRARARTKSVLAAGGVAAVLAAAIALGGAGVFDGRQDSAPRSVGALPNMPGDQASAHAAPPHGSNVTSGATISSHRRTGETDEGSDGAKGPNAARNRRHVDEPPAHHELRQPPAMTISAADHRPSRPKPRPKRAPGHPRSEHPTSPGRGGMPSLLEMQCDEMFPAHKREFRVRNIACHSLLGS